MNTNQKELKITAFRGVCAKPGREALLTQGEAVQMLNFRVDENGYLKKRSGYARICTLPVKPSGICYCKLDTDTEYAWYLVCQNTLYRYVPAYAKLQTVAQLPSAGTSAQVEMFFSHGALYFLDGKEYSVCHGAQITPVEGYIPLRFCAVDPATGIGNEQEAVNLLSAYGRATFRFRTDTDTFTLPESAAGVLWVKRGGLTCMDFTVVEAPGTDGRMAVKMQTAFLPSEEYVEICYRRLAPSGREKLTACPHVYRYGGSGDVRLLFFGGDGGQVWFSADAAQGPTYVPQDAHFIVGRGQEPVTGVCRCFDHLLLFTAHQVWSAAYQSAQKNFALYLLRGDLGNLSPNSVQSIGRQTYSCDGKAVYRWEAASVQGEHKCTRISDPITGQLSETAFAGVRTAVNYLTGELFLQTDTQLWIYQCEQDVWYRYDGIDADGFCSAAGAIGFYRDCGLFCMDDDCCDDDGETIVAVWEGEIPRFTEDGRRRNLLCASVTLFSKEPTEVSVVFTGDRTVMRFPHVRCGQEARYGQTVPLGARLILTNRLKVRITAEDACDVGVCGLQLWLYEER